MPKNIVYYIHDRRDRKKKDLATVVVSVFVFLWLSGVFEVFGVGGPPSPAPFVTGLVWLALVGAAWSWRRSMPHTLVLSDDGKITFMSVFRTTQIGIHEIKSIEPAIPAAEPHASVVVKTGALKITISKEFNDFHDFISRVKAANPDAIIRGC